MQDSIRDTETRLAARLRANKLEETDQTLSDFADLGLRYFDRLKARAAGKGVADADLDDAVQETIEAAFAVIVHHQGDNREEILEMLPRHKKQKGEQTGKPWTVMLASKTPLWTLLMGIMSYRIGREWGRKNATRIARRADEDPCELPADVAHSPEAEAALHEEAARLGAALGSLSVHERQLFVAAIRGELAQYAKKRGISLAKAYRDRASAIRAMTHYLENDHFRASALSGKRRSSSGGSRSPAGAFGADRRRSIRK